MSLYLNTNIMALEAQQNLGINTQKYAQAIQRLSSGMRINSAADDAAGLAVSDKLTAQINGTQQASRNAQDASSMIQTGDGALAEVTTMMQRMRELAVEAANGTLGASDLGQINQELQALQSNINGVSSRTQFNGQNLLSGSLVTTQKSTSTVLVGKQYNTTGGNSSIAAVNVSTAAANTTFNLTTASAGTLTLTNATTGVAQTLTLSAIAANTTSTINFSQLGVSIQVSTDSGGKTAAGQATDLAGGTIITNSGSGSATMQIGSNSGNTINVNFKQIDLTGSTGDAGLDGLATALNAFNTSQTTTNASALISAADSALNSVDTQRAAFGAVENSLQDTVNYLSVANTNLTASQSQIQNADVAQETTHMVSAQILMQAGTSVLAQANQIPQTALTLLPH